MEKSLDRTDVVSGLFRLQFENLEDPLLGVLQDLFGIVRRIVALAQDLFAGIVEATLQVLVADDFRVVLGMRRVRDGVENVDEVIDSTDLLELVSPFEFFAERHGVNPSSSAVYNSITDKGAPVDSGSRTWPNTERIKAAIARFEVDGDDPRPVINESAGLLLDCYLDIEPRGIWIDHFDRDGTSLVTTAPTSTLYHVFLAFAEILRVKDKLA